MKLIHSLLFVLSLSCAASAQISSLKAVMFNATNGQVVANTTNTLTFTNLVKIRVPNDTNVDAFTVIGGGDNSGGGNQSLVIRNATVSGTNDLVPAGFELGVAGLTFSRDLSKKATRDNLGLGATWLTNTTREAFQNDIFTTNKWIVSGGPSIFSVVASWASGTWVSSIPLDVTDPAGPDMPSYKAMTRTNLGLGATWLTNTNATNFRNAIGLGATNNVTFNNITISDQTLTLSHGEEDNVFVRNDRGDLELEGTGQIVAFNPIGFNNTTNAATTRINLGLGATWLTNTSAINISMGVTATNTNTGQVLTGGTNGSLFMKGGDSVAYSSAIEPGGNAGYINLNGAPGGDGDGGDGGYINLSAGTDNGHGGSIDLRGDQYSKGGSIISTGSNYGGRNGGTLNMSAGDIPTGGNRSGGSITTMSGGGSIDTTGTGTIELGISNTRTTFVGSATTNRSISLPDASGTIALTNTLGSWAVTTNASTARTNLGLAGTNNVTFNGLRLGEYGKLSFITAAESDIAEISVLTNPSTRMRFGIGTLGFPVAITATGLEIGTSLAGQGAISFSQNNTNGAATTRTNLGLGATWLTNSTAPLFWTSVPSTPTNSGTAGQIAYTNNFLYICISNNTWRRVQLGTW